MNLRVAGIVEDSIVDGPGFRFTVFVQGCSHHCEGCHNPQTHDPGGGKELSTEEIIREMRSNPLTDGLTLSGGEPFAQPEFTLQLLHMAKEAGIHTAVETSGYTSPAVMQEAAKVTDLFLYDYKVTDPTLHQTLCGVSNERILTNLTLLDTLDAEVILRCPIIPGQNDDPDHIRGIGLVASAHKCVREIHLEPYHQLGKGKATQLGLETVFGATPPTQETMTQYCRDIQDICGKRTCISS